MNKEQIELEVTDLVMSLGYHIEGGAKYNGPAIERKILSLVNRAVHGFDAEISVKANTQDMLVSSCK